jgi:hypothetical protein
MDVNAFAVRPTVKLHSSMIELSEVIYSPAKPKSEESKNVKIGLIKPL